MNEVWQRRLLFVAATWNILGGASALFDPMKHFSQMYTAALALDQPVQLFFYRCTWINVMAWGIAYLLAAFLPNSRTAVLTAGTIGKFVYFLACWSLFNSGAGTTMLLGTGMFDLLLSALFAVALFSRKQGTSIPTKTTLV